MMDWYGHDWGMSVGGWGVTYGILSIITWLLFIAVLILAVIWLWKEISKK